MNINLDIAQQLIDMIADAAVRVVNETRPTAPATAPRVRRTKAEIAAAAALAAPVAALVAPAPAPAPDAAPDAAPAVALAADTTALRAKLIAAVRTSLATNGEDETKTRLGHPNISSVPDVELAETIARMVA